MLKDLNFRIQLGQDSITLFDENEFMSNNLEGVKLVGPDSVAYVDSFLNINYQIELETRDYGIKSIILSSSSIQLGGVVDYYLDDEGNLGNTELDVDLSDFDIIFEKDEGVDSIYPKDAEVYFKDKKIVIQY